MNPERFKNFGIGLAFLLIQVMLFRHLKIMQVQPDLLLIFLVWYMARKDRTAALLMAAGLGFLQDAMLDLWGLNMFSKTLLVFMSYNFIPRGSKKQLLIGQVFLTIAIAALIHNLIFLGLNIAIESYTGEQYFWRHLIGSSLYTAFVASFIQLFRTN
ncbi:rod shape-determining protein MreD [Fodinibius sp.]|uniref:rod shape-determining protein MreD n=1 Tax=Fodinibius sp. TaxID=1872440 RepID=UPI002ACE9B13|nr:rod shape-determining protein MreD [Fodinibius sp.]MDZ7658442.1 rod shape-determining protein MreD [Fodinibius sp.]